MGETGDMREVIASIDRSRQSFNIAVTLAAKGIVYLIGYMMRLEKENMLKKGAIEKYTDFVWATGGAADIFNIPLAEPDEGLRKEYEAYVTKTPETRTFDLWYRKRETERIKEKLKAYKVTYCVMPELSSDRRIQVSVYRKDAEKFAMFQKEYIDEHLHGGEVSLANLEAMTDRRTSIVAVPTENAEDIENMKHDLTAMGISFALLPDLRVGDDEVQVVLSNNDVGRMQMWYTMLQREKARSGARLADMKTYTASDYLDTAKLTPKEYTQGADESIKARMKKYDETKAESRLVDAFERLRQEVRPISDPAYFTYSDDVARGRSVFLTVDEDRLINGTGAFPLMLKDGMQNVFAFRYPGTEGEGERIVCLPKSHVFRDDLAPGRYYAFADKGEELFVFDGKGTKVTDEALTDPIKLETALKDFNKGFDEAAEKAVEEAAKALGTDAVQPAKAAAVSSELHV